MFVRLSVGQLFSTGVPLGLNSNSNYRGLSSLNLEANNVNLAKLLPTSCQSFYSEWNAKWNFMVELWFELFELMYFNCIKKYETNNIILFFR